MTSEAYRELGPTTQTALARQPERQSPSLERQPATDEQFRNELTACLALVAPAGMPEENRRDWLAVAWATLKHLPAGLLAEACHEARKTCDHPSKIVPAIIGYAEPRLRESERIERACRPVQRLPHHHTHIPHEETQRIIREAFAESEEERTARGQSIGEIIAKQIDTGG
jgi:hypothetical protein